MSTPQILQEIFDKLLKHFGPQDWWPGDTPLEIMVGAVLTQNTNWTNVAKAIENLKREHLLSFDSLKNISSAELAPKIQSAGYFNVKAVRLKNLIRFIEAQEGGDLEKIAQQPTSSLREKLLAIRGIGPETADSILLYAFQKPVFVIDQYTYRVLNRHFLVSEETSYEQMQELMMANLAQDVSLFNEYHALLVQVGKQFCRPKPICTKCPLNGVNWGG